MWAPLLLALVAVGSPDPSEWRKVVDGDVQVFRRSVPGERIAQIKADMVMSVTPAEVREVLIDESFSSRAPYIGEYRNIDHPEPMRWIRYTRLALPVINDRDYFIDLVRESDLAPDGSGVYHASWKPWGIDRPTRKGVIRVNVNSGYWDLKTAPDGVHAQVEYYLSFDPGGILPAWAIDAGNKRILPDVLHAVEKEALKRRDEKAQAAK